MKNSRYEVILWWSAEDSAFAVDVPEFPGCMAHGANRSDAIKNAETAIAFWIKTARVDGHAIPQPKGRASSLTVELSDQFDRRKIVAALLLQRSFADSILRTDAVVARV